MLLTSSAPLRLLVVDDIADNRTLINRRFSKRGFEIVEADSGLAALDLIAQQTFDLVLLDIMMPGLDGFEVLRRIRLTHTPDDLPVVMVTARAGNTDIVQALELGANDYVTKPIDFAIAFARIQNQVARGQAQKELARSIAQLIEINGKLEQEIAERKRSEDRLYHMARHDALTGLGNRVLFRDELRRALQHVASHRPLAVLFLDLIGFKLTNDTLGQTAGDRLLVTIGDRLLDVVQDRGLVARVGSDEFAIVGTDVTGTDQAARLADAIAAAVAMPCVIDGADVMPDCRIGITMAMSNVNGPDVLLGQAHMAMQRARDEVGSFWRFFESGMDERAQERRVMESDLRKALAADQFELYFQPIYNLDTNAVSGCEALLRWDHPVRGMISPADFIPLAEELGLIVPIGEWVLQAACREAVRWPAGIKIAVNISSVQFRSPALIQTVTAALSESGLAPNRLEIEITESLLLDDHAGTLDILHHLRSMGIRISMDDFGTGYSSLSYLSQFPFDKLKIDQSFTRKIDGTCGNATIARAILALADGLGLVTTAEGVETQAQLAWLRQESCDEVQGYYISRPVPAHEVAALLEHSRSVCDA